MAAVPGSLDFVVDQTKVSYLVRESAEFVRSMLETFKALYEVRLTAPPTVIRPTMAPTNSAIGCRRPLDSSIAILLVLMRIEKPSPSLKTHKNSDKSTISRGRRYANAYNDSPRRNPCEECIIKQDSYSGKFKMLNQNDHGLLLSDCLKGNLMNECVFLVTILASVILDMRSKSGR
jgi:hypothetical protein